MHNTLQGKEGLSEIAGFGLQKENNFPSNEPISVLDTGWSPSPSTSTSTFSSSLAGGGGGSTDNRFQKNWSIFMVPESRPEEVLAQPLDSGIPDGKWVPELNPFPAGPIACGGGTFGYDTEDWGRIMSEWDRDPPLLRWIPGESGANPNEIDQNVALGFPEQSSTAEPTMAKWSSSHRDGEIGTSPINNPGNSLTNQVDFNQNSLPPLLYSQEQEQICLLQPPAKRQNLGGLDNYPQEPLKAPILEHQSLMGFPQNPTMVLKQEVVVPPLPPERHHHNHRQVVYDQLYKAAELIQAGNFSHAQGILARLNYYLSPLENPFQRSALYFKEALLQLPLIVPPVKNPTPVDCILKMGAYKLLSEASPLIQFMNFTSNQALLEAVGDAESVHLIDFDVGFGAQWASFMQELPLIARNRTRALKITAFASPSTHHPLQLCLMHQTLTQLALDIGGINLELEVVNFDTFDPNSYSIISRPEEEALVVNFPIWACSGRLSLLPSLLRFVKRLKPKITVSLERGCDRPDLPFAQHLLQSLHHYEALLDSIDGANLSSEAVNKVERLLMQPRIESIVWGRFTGPAGHIPHPRAVFGSAGFSPVGFSSFSEDQAEYLVRRSPVKGFRVEKRSGGSLVLYWQRRELVLASAWRC